LRATDTLTDDEYVRLCCHCKALVQGTSHKRARQGFLVFLMLQTGLRIGETVKLFATDLIIGSDIVKNLRVRTEIAKNKKERIIPLNESVRELTESWFSRHYTHTPDTATQWLLHSSHCNNHITTRQGERIVAKVSREAIERTVHPHMLRHTFATRLLKVSNMRVVQMLLGHSSIQSTQVYTHPDNQELSKAVNGLNA